MDDLPMVSVIMPVRDESAYIERSLGAVLRQDYPAERTEILVVDGMSTDGTREFIRARQIV
ncbi:MAG TPA: glycosyltransferase, partial [Promineifilum sp.]|nr:glycosyltransferase [Promineifilum sp.]